MGGSSKQRNSTKRIGNKNIAIGDPTNATKNGESMEDLHSGVGFAYTTDSASDKPNRRRYGMASPSASPVIPNEPPSPQSTLASFRFGGSAPSSKPPSPTRVTPPPVTDDSEDIVQDVIQFRKPTSRQQAAGRVLYDGQSQLASPATRTYVPGSAYFDSRRKSSAASTASWVHTPSMDDRRPSLVKPEDYLPGLPASANAGKAMAAGFDPQRPATPVSTWRIALYCAQLKYFDQQHSAIPIPRRIGVPIKSAAHENTDAEKLSVKPDESELDFDLGNADRGTYDNDYDISQIYGADRAEEDVNAVSVPTLYSNSYAGTANLNFHAAESEAKRQQDRYTSFNSDFKLPRDSSTGRIDVSQFFGLDRAHS